MARTEYYDDPAAPTPNSLVVATSAVVVDDAGRILLQRRADSGNWALPGGAMEMNESLVDSVIREVEEETGLTVEVTGLVGTYTDPRHVIAYANGEVRRQFNICFSARMMGGELRVSNESTAGRAPGSDEVRCLRLAGQDRGSSNHTVTASVVLLMTGRWVGWFAAMNEGAGGASEHQERLWLLHHPWEEDYLHWVGEGDQRRLHGTVPPPQDGRPHSTTRSGWCRGLATEQLQARRDGSLGS